MTIGIDADGILFDYISVAALYVNHLAGQTIATYENCNKWDCLDAWKRPNWDSLLNSYFSCGSVVENIPVMSEANILIDGIRKLTDDFVIITACPPSWHVQRSYSLKKHFNIDKRQINYSYTKHLFNVDLLIDDYHENFRHFRGWRVMPDRPWNRDTDGVAVVRTYNVYETLGEVERIVKWNKKVSM